MNKKNLNFTDRVTIEYHLKNNPRVTAIHLAKLLKVSRSTIYYELKHNTTISKSYSARMNGGIDIYECDLLKRFPFCCNGCARTKCVHRSHKYSAYDAHSKAQKNRILPRINIQERNKIIKVLNESISPLIKNGNSIHAAILSSKSCDISESTIRRYIEKGLLDAKRGDLPKACKFRVKKEYKTHVPALSADLLYGRTYSDFKMYTSAYSNLKIVQLDSVIGKADDKYALLTIFFVNSKLQVGILYNRNNSNVVNIMRSLHSACLSEGFELFNVVLADNGSEFKNLYKLEKDNDDNDICKVFYCDPYRSCQKAECEKNHVFFRRIIPKGHSLDTLSQSTVDIIFSHINSYPRKSLSDKTPYDVFLSEYSYIILSILKVFKIHSKDVTLKYFFFKEKNK